MEFEAIEKITKMSQNKRSSSPFESVCEPRTFGMRSLTC